MESKTTERLPVPLERREGIDKQDSDLPLLLVDRASSLPTAIGEKKFLARGRILKLLFLAFLLIGIGVGMGIVLQPTALQWHAFFFDSSSTGGMASISSSTSLSDEQIQNASVPHFVVGLGKLGPQGDVVTVAPPFGANDARVASLLVKEGDVVEKNALLAVLDSEPSLQAAVHVAQAAVAARTAALRQSEAFITASRAEAMAALGRAEAEAANAESAFARVESLSQRGVATNAILEESFMARETARHAVEQAKATLARYEGPLDRQPDIVVAVRNRDTALAELARAQAELEKAYVRAPMTATVLTIQVQVGERPGDAGIMNLGDLSTMQAEIEIYQTDINTLDIGNLVTLTSEAIPEPLHAVITHIGFEVGRQGLIAPTPAANTDARIVKVIATLDAISSLAARRFTNLEVLARIAVSGPS